MKAFVINLERSPERLANFSRQMARLGLPFERIAAVDGRILAYRHCLRELLVEQRWLAPGEIGCALSHLAVCARMRDGGIDRAAVFEDDVLLAPELVRVLERAEGFLRTDRPQVVLLSAHGCLTARESGVERIGSGMCTDGYVLNRAAAELILRLNTPVVCPADTWVRWIRRGGLELYRIWPTTVTQDKSRFPESEVCEGHVALHGVRLAVHRVVKGCCLSLDWLWLRLTGE